MVQVNQKENPGRVIPAGSIKMKKNERTGKRSNEKKRY